MGQTQAASRYRCTVSESTSRSNGLGIAPSEPHPEESVSTAALIESTTVALVAESSRSVQCRPALGTTEAWGRACTLTQTQPLPEPVVQLRGLHRGVSRELADQVQIDTRLQWWPVTLRRQAHWCTTPRDRCTSLRRAVLLPPARRILLPPAERLARVGLVAVRQRHLPPRDAHPRPVGVLRRGGGGWSSPILR